LSGHKVRLFVYTGVVGYNTHLRAGKGKWLVKVAIIYVHFNVCIYDSVKCRYPLSL